MASDDKQRSITALRDLRPGMKNVTCVFIVIDKGTTNQTKDGSIVRKCRVADRSASICFSLWNEQAGAIEPGDILRLIKGYASVWKGGLMLYSGKYGILEKIGEFSMVFSETPDMSDPNQDFLQSQQAPHHHQPSPRGGGGGGGGVNPPQHHHQPPTSGGGYSTNSIPPQGGPHNGRMGMGYGMNRNGNNHINQGMATGYSPAPERQYPPSEFNHERPPEKNYSTNHRHSPPPSSQSSAPLQYQSQAYEFRAKQLGGPSSNSPHEDHGRTMRGGYRNFYPDRHHPYSRPPPASDPPRHSRGAWR